MNIAIVCYPTHGGSGVVATELGLHLAQKGHQIHFISYNAPFRLTTFQPNIYYHEVDVSAYPLFKFPPYDLSLATTIIKVAEENNIDIVHAHYAIPHAISAYLAKKMLKPSKIKVITTLHGTDITLVGKDPSFYRVVQFSIEESDGVTAVSHYLADRTREIFKIRKTIDTIYNFIDPDRFNGIISKCNRKDFAPNGEKLLMHASNFRPVKRVSDMIKILAKVNEHLPAKLIFIGEGPDHKLSHELAKEYGILDKVIYLGTQDYIENLLACADLFLLPSEEESFGLAALEALSSKTPVIASRIGGLPEVIDHNVNGLLYPVADLDGMVSGILELLNNDSLYASFQQQARDKAIDAFHYQKIVPLYERYYEKILQHA